MQEDATFILITGSEDEKSDPDASVIITGSREDTSSDKSEKNASQGEIVEINPKEYLHAKQKQERDEARWLKLQQKSRKRRCTQPGDKNLEGVCSICYCEQNLWIAKCKHVCCQNCWKKWLTVRKKCPVCRQHTRIRLLSLFVPTNQS